ncbi:ArsR/SmtB family transcription factor [Cytobacillus sp. IB215665]|uniref:ArsR/SmtB family transcription factor n=1 Tax=Cytobacillus sp. IB215665 TaxID=3097357 RepID=UPI002A17E2C7|nr:helix-turn-helix domain-containing protein [Cytobacillus sp. IB215665]MDX8366739.1 helix-turn-helix domain-containing protein [Cytobacillus sp. IB215665]
MSGTPDLAKVASLVSENSRAAILTVLLDGRFHPASELAYMAQIKPQTASFHLTKMVDANLITMEKHGRHRYYSIRNQEVAQVMESLLSIAPRTEIRSLKQASEDKAVRFARTCYDHLAGSLGIQLTDSLVKSGILCNNTTEFEVTDKGEEFFASLQINLQEVKNKRRAFAHKCLDWSERRHHLAGALGNALLERILELNWIQRSPNSRAITITTAGKKGFKDIFMIDV